MRGVVIKLYTAALALLATSAATYHFGTRYALARAPQPTAPECAMCFGVGDEWKVLAGLLLVVAVALAFAATTMWLRERRSGGPVSIV
ncbi:MAG TPA: hypothetical protein VGV38_12470 [Pyrinomonadaceae bacterium]|nr:hypothetical protein [Pyrinomonadaceae bacterium]